MDHHASGRRSMASPEVAMASEVFDQFCAATTLKSILGHFRHLCDLLKIKPTNFAQFYPKLKSKLKSWKAQALWKKFDQRANHKCYNRGKACLNTRVLIIGGGPCGLRSAIEAQLLGAKVVVIEKRDRMSRNNVLHLWPFVIHDLRALGAKKFFGKFCAGSIDHISIRQIQCILLKVALILGVEFHENVSFEALVDPPENQEEGKIGWRAKTTPADHPVSQYEFDALIGADGKRNTLEGFRRKEFRGKLAIAITANFINKRTEAEARVEEISGVAFIFNQKFFKELYQETGIDLENIVYYKDDTHYFVMTAKKHSLIDKGVILQDHVDTAKLLAKENVDREALMYYAREAAEFSTEYQMMDMEFAVNHYGQPDVAMFDFTSMYAAENASRIIERRGHRLLMILVGDSLLEPFWPTGSGCARGFLSSLDACWAIKSWSASLTPLEVLAERESIYRLLGQTTPENLNRDYAAYTLDPHTRYPNLNVRSVTHMQVTSQLDTDDPETFKLSPTQTAIDLPKKRRRRDSQVHPDTLLYWLQRQVALYDGVRINDMGLSFKSGLAIAAIIHRYRPDLIDFGSLNRDDPVATNQMVFDILEKELGIVPIMTGEEMVQCEVPDKLAMFSYLKQIYESFRGEIPHIKHPKLELENEDRPTFSQKLNLLTPEQKAHLLGRMQAKHENPSRRRSRHTANENMLAVPTPDKKADARRSRKRRSTEKVGASVDRDVKMHIGKRRDSVDEEFSGRIKNFEEKLKGNSAAEKKPKDLLRAIGKIEKTDWNVKEIEKKIEESKMGRGMRQDKIERVPKWSREQFLARQIKMEKKGRDPSEIDSKYAEIDNTIKNIDKKIKEGNVLGLNKVSAMAEQFANKNQDHIEPKIQRSNSKVAVILPAQGGSEMCHFCGKRVYLMERLTAEGKSFHRGCFRCEYCSTSLRIGSHTFDRDKGRFYCAQHYGLSGTMKTKADKKKSPLTNKENIPQSSLKNSSDKAKTSLEGVVGLDLLDRGQTPERIEFENLAELSDAEEALSQMDEDEWTDRNFGPSAAEMCSSDDVSDMSDSDEDDDDDEVFEEAIDQPLTTEGTLELAKNWTLRYSNAHPPTTHSDTGSNEYEDSSDEYTGSEGDSETATEDEDDVQARLLRKKEVYLQNPPRNSDTETGSDTEIASDEETSESDSEENSATEISTDSEFEHDGTTPTQRDIPQITINDSYVRKTRGDYVEPKKVQIKSRIITTVNGTDNAKKKHHPVKVSTVAKNNAKNAEEITNHSNLTTLNSKTSTVSPSTFVNSRKSEAYLLNRTHSTEGIASKLSLELKKRYLLGSSGIGSSISKSGSASNVVDTKLKTLSDSISQHQKLLNPAPEPSPTMQAFLYSANNRRSPLSPSPLFTNSPSIKVFPFDKNEEQVNIDAKTNHLPDLIKSTADSDELKENEKNVSITKIESNNICKTGNGLPVGKDYEDEIRSRSPLHETSIIVPQVDWEKTRKQEEIAKIQSSEDSEMDSDSLSASSDTEQVENEKKVNLSPPRLQIHSTDGDLLLDEQIGKLNTDNFEPDSIECVAREISEVKIQEEPVEGSDANMQRLQIEEDKVSQNISNCSSPLSAPSDFSEDNAETEMSEWAKDGDNLVSEPLQELECTIDPSRRNKLNAMHALASVENGQEQQHGSCLISRLLINHDDIGFMDTDNDSVLDDSLQETTPTKVKYNAPIARTENEIDSEDEKPLPTKVFPDALSMDEDSLLIVDQDTTNSELTNTIVVNPTVTNSSNSADTLKADDNSQGENPDYLEYVKRLQSRIAEFSNAKDSIDVRKSKRKNSKSGKTAAEAMIAEEREQRTREHSPTGSNGCLSSGLNSPATSRKLEEITKERSKQKSLVQDLLMDKFESQKQKSAEKRAKRVAARTSSFVACPTISPMRPPPSPPESSSTTTSTPMNSPSHQVDEVDKISISGEVASDFKMPATPVASTRTTKNEEARLASEKARQDARERARMKSDEDLGLSPEDRIKRLRAKVARRQLNMDPDKVEEVKMKRYSFGLMRSGHKLQTSKSTGNVSAMARKADAEEALEAAKSLDELTQTSPTTTESKEEPDVVRRDKKKSKDPERRRSIIQAVSNFFKKKDSTSSSSPPSSKEKVSMFRLTSKSKDKAKLFKSYSDGSDLDKISPNLKDRPKSICEGMLDSFLVEESPPAAPAPLISYALFLNTSECSLSEDDSNTAILSLSQSAKIIDNADDNSNNSNTKKFKSSKRTTRQAQLKRLRMAQEIQRKLEETEVKQRELESRGVSVEKALRGEGECSEKDESELLREWFDLMRERKEVRRYEKELLVRAQEVQLEDRHDRLQQELRERLADDDKKKTSADVKKEGEILTEMLEIVSRRDSLIALLEEERQRYKEEDRDLEAQMLAKGLRLTPVKRSSTEYIA